MMQYNTSRDHWTKLTGPPNLDRCSAVVGWKGRIVVFGDTNGTKVVEEFDPATSQWSLWDIKLPTMGRISSVFQVTK
jgi:hypothetical protein